MVAGQRTISCESYLGILDILSHAVEDCSAPLGLDTWQNGYAERLMRTIKEEEIDFSDYVNYADAVRQVGRFLDEVYMHKRIHYFGTDILSSQYSRYPLKREHYMNKGRTNNACQESSFARPA